MQLHTLSNNLTIECGEVDGVVLGLWRYVSKHSDVPVLDDDDDDVTHASYWAAPAVWSDAWDQTTIDRVSLHLNPLSHSVQNSRLSQKETNPYMFLIVNR